MRPPLSVSVALAAALGLLPWTPPARAQEAAPPPGGAVSVAPPTLAQALAQAEVSRDTVYLAVAADKVTPPRDMPPLPPGAPIPQVAGAYGRLVQSWETAGAVAPPTMTLLNADPGAPNPYDGLPAQDALKLLLGGLDDSQWAALTGSGGLGYGALTGQSQREMFRAIFPGDELTAQPPGDYDPQHGITLTADDLQQARLRLSQQVMLMLQVAGQPNSHSGTGMSPDDGKTRYSVGLQNGAHQGDTLYGVKVRAAIPNALKPSDLDCGPLTQTVGLQGVRTVGDLVHRVGAATRLELYADRRYEKRTVTFAGPASARAGDLLRALALCVCGAYRKVGPAYVLTDDLRGLGTRQMILGRFAQAADMARAGAMADAGDKMVLRGGILALPPAAPGLGVTDAEEAQAQKDDPSWDPRTAPYIQVPFGVLPLPQQALARREAKQMQGQQQTNPGWQNAVTLDGTVMVQPQPTLELLSAAVSGPVVLDDSVSTGQLFQPSDTLRQKINEEGAARWQQRQKQQADAVKSPPPPAPVPVTPPPSLARLFAPLSRRAVIAAPRTAQDVDAVIASMRQIGLNQLWLDVFSGGKSHLDGTPDILTEALTKAKGTGISVVPTLDLLIWGTDAPEDARDRDILGETSAERDAVSARYSRVVNQGATPEEAAKQPAPTTLSASPVSPSVRQALTALVGRLAATPGVGALALRQTVTDGYGRPADSQYGQSGDTLGYTTALRLALLRRAHVDPVDLAPGVNSGQGVTVDTSLPEFDDPDALGDADKQWNGLRYDAERDLMRALLAAAQGAAGRRFPLWVKQRRTTWRGDWYGLWDDPRAPLPELPEEAAFGGTGPDTDYAVLARAQSRLNVFRIQSWAGQDKNSLTSTLQQIKPGWDGFVLDYTASDFGGQGGAPAAGDPLASLAQSLTPAAPARRVSP